MNTFEKIAHLAQVETLEKYAGTGSEFASSLVNPVNWVASMPAFALGALVGEKDQKDIPDDKWKNLLIPGLGPYRLGKRLHANMSAKDQLSSDEIARIGLLKKQL